MCIATHIYIHINLPTSEAVDTSRTLSSRRILLAALVRFTALIQKDRQYTAGVTFNANNQHMLSVVISPVIREIRPQRARRAGDVQAQYLHNDYFESKLILMGQ